MNREQIKKINLEILQLLKRAERINLSPNYAEMLKSDMSCYIRGRIDSLKWVKDNI